MSTSGDVIHTTTPPIQRLPVELLEHILSFVKHQQCSGSTSLPWVSLVCKQWNTANKRVFWHSIRLTDDNVAAFSKAPPPNGAVHIKSLTLSTSATRWKGSNSNVKTRSTFRVQKRPQPDFKRLAARIAAMERLTTLSVIENHVEADCSTSSSQRKIAQLLNNVPPSVRSLEVDIATCPDCHIDSKICLSTIISRLLPQLEHLRLRIPVLCPALLTPAPKLRSITINLAWAGMYNICRCQKRMEYMFYGTRRRPEDVDDRCKFFAAALDMLTDEAAPLPVLTHFTLLATHNFDDDRCGPSHLLLKDDLIGDQTVAYPLWCINDDDDDRAEELWALRRSDAADPEDRDLVGTTPELETFMERSLWSDSIYNVRAVGARVSDTILPTSSMKAYLACTEREPGGLCDLWQHERTAQRCLMVPQTVPLGGVPLLNMERYGECEDDSSSTTRNDDADPTYVITDENEHEFDDENDLRSLISCSPGQHSKHDRTTEDVDAHEFDNDKCPAESP